MSARGLRAWAVVVALLATAWLIRGLDTPVAPLPDDARANRIVVEKAARRLTLYAGDRVLKAYDVALGREPVGAKEREGDRRTPEGLYVIDNHNAASRFHKALHVSYPSAADVARAKAGGYPPGGMIMVHGIRNGLGWVGRLHRLRDWTVGCIAVTDAEIDEIYRAVTDGTPIEIRP